ncbi:hypothetical protein [Methanocorpusculum bavaricum]|nr:hypothetical protein [Methanocorpusculum bavaricum]
MTPGSISGHPGRKMAAGRTDFLAGEQNQVCRHAGNPVFVETLFDC